MRKPISLPFITFISFLFIASWVSAADGVLFGPKQYIRTSGPPNVFTDTFMGGPGVARLIVKNGNYIAGRKVEDAATSATITVNGVQVFGTDDFKKKVHLLESPIILTGGNSISVVLKSSPGSHLTISVMAEAGPPIATISSAPSSMMIGDSCTLSWNATNADSCFIAPAIGEVDPIGSRVVSPTETTTYTITATGLGGMASASVTVTVTHPIPTVTLSADPGTIQVGQSSVLNWSSINAVTVGIEPNMGSVETTGSIVVSPMQTTIYRITATGPGGTATDSASVVVISQISLRITSPSHGELLYVPAVMVQGEAMNSTGKETGVTVNGIPAEIYGNRFVANHVPLREGENAITAIAMDAGGNGAAASITVNAQPAENYIQLTADPASGVAPFETTLTADGSFSFIVTTPTYTGPGAVEFLDSSEENKFTVKMTTPGIYYFAVETELEGVIYTNTVAVCPTDGAELDALLRAKWNQMKSKLIIRDIDGALEYFTTGRPQHRYRQIFDFIEANVPGGISADAQNFPEPLLIKIAENVATYILVREENGKMVEYILYFVKDHLGLWKVHEY